MGTTDVLLSSIQHTHDGLAERLRTAQAMAAPPGEPRHDRQCMDEFLCEASKHLHAVDAVLLQPARKQVPDGGTIVHEYLRSAKDFEVVLAHVKAHEYGSVYESSFSWPAVWSDVREAMSTCEAHELVLGDRLTATLDDDQLDELASRLHDAEESAPTRPHPYQPHTGPFAGVARRVMHTADRFMDTVEGRMVPEPAPAPKKPPGRFAQYFLADPRFDPDEK